VKRQISRRECVHGTYKQMESKGKLYRRKLDKLVVTQMQCRFPHHSEQDQSKAALGPLSL